MPFGSYFTELYLPTSDIDIVCVVENLANVSETVLRKAAKSLLKSNIADATTIKIISKARVPLVKFTDVRTRYTVDISFNQDSGVDGSEHIKSLVNRFPALRPLLLVMKQFLVVRGLNEVYMGGLGSYALTLLIASFLRLHPMLQSKWIRQDLNLGVLLIEFMELYGKLLNYDQVGVSLLNGYFLKEKRGWLNGKKSSLLSVEDPYEQENDVTKGTFGIQTVRQALSHGYDILTSLITLLQHSTNVVESSVNPNSFLSAVLDIPEEVLEHRNFIHHL